MTHGDCIGCARQRELRTAVEAEPSKPQNEDAQSNGWDVGRRRELDAAVGANFPNRAPTTSAPASAAQPPVECTMVEPAKSLNPIALSQPPPQVQAPTMG